MALKTRKIYKYRGFRVYLRHLFGNLFEYLILDGDDIYEHGFRIGYNKCKRGRFFNQDELLQVDEMMMEVANNFIDTKIYERSLKSKINKLIFNAKRYWIWKTSPLPTEQR